MRIFLNTFFIFSFIYASCQNYQVEDVYEEQFGRRYAPIVTFRNALLARDYLMGLEAGILSPAENLSFFVSFDVRPFRKKILNHHSGNLFYQNAEQRFFAGAGAEYLWRMNEKNYGVFFHLNGSYTWAYYGGTELKPPNGFVLHPKVGAFWQFSPSFLLKGGYAYQDTTNDQIEPHRLYIAITGIIRTP